MLNVLYEDNHVLIINKPEGLLSQKAHASDISAVDLVESYLIERYQKPGRAYVGLIHRLDRMTSGALLLAKTSKAAERLSKQSREHGFEKRYLAFVAGQTPPSGELVDQLESSEEGSRVVRGSHGKVARLSYERLAFQPASQVSVLAVTLETGRKHQIRVQFASRRFPLLGDRRYAPPQVAQMASRTALHAASLSFEHPITKERISVIAPLAKDLITLAKRYHVPLDLPTLSPFMPLP